MGDCFVKKYRARFNSNESNALLEEYLVVFATTLGQMFGNSIEELNQAKEYAKNCDALPLGFGAWFRKYGAGMLSRLSRSDFSEDASDEFLDELDYYLMSLREDLDEHDLEAVCSDLVASLTRLSKMLASESCWVWEDEKEPKNDGFQMKTAGRGVKYIEKVSIEYDGDFFGRKAA